MATFGTLRPIVRSMGHKMGRVCPMRGMVFSGLLLSLLGFSMGILACDEPGQDFTWFQGEDSMAMGAILKDRESKAAFLEVYEDGAFQCYLYQEGARTLKELTLLLEGDKKGLYALPEENGRPLYVLKHEKGQAILAERHLPLEGAYNFRDLGGIPTRDGLYTKWGKLFRADEPEKLSLSDWRYMDSLGLLHYLDFRTEDEVAGNSFPPKEITEADFSPPKREWLPIQAGELFSGEVLYGIVTGALGEEELEEIMLDAYRQMVENEDALKAYRRMFQLMMEEDGAPLLYHCTAGKDRTGIATLLILSALHVDQEVIFSDYLASASYLEGKYDDFLDGMPAILPLITVKRSYLEAALERIDEVYGSLEAFLDEALGVDRPLLKERYLYQP